MVHTISVRRMGRKICVHGRPCKKELGLTLHSVTVSVPHPEKVRKRGEDAAFSHERGIGVFDGVGGWAEMNIDAGAYSKGLASAAMSSIRHRLHRGRLDEQLAAKAILSDAVQKTSHKGSSTAVIAVVNGDMLNVCNLGDSGAVVVRGDEVAFVTDEQQHTFNCPLQVAYDAREDLDNAAVYDFKLREGDLVLMATDGVWDNVWMHEILGLIVKYTASWPMYRNTSIPPNITNTSTAATNAFFTTTPCSNMTVNPICSPITAANKCSSTRQALVQLACGRDACNGAKRNGSSVACKDTPAIVDDAAGRLERAAFSVSLHKRTVGKETCAPVYAETVKKLAFDIASRACVAGHRLDGSSPFAEKAAEIGMFYDGGKLDDVTITVAVALRTRSSFRAMFQATCCDANPSPTPTPSS